MQKELKYIMLLLSIVTMSCTKENIEDCPSNVNLHFRFTLHEEPEKGNLFGLNVKSIGVYVFDKGGILQQIRTEKGAILTNDYVMSFNLQQGLYSIVAWASDNDIFFNTHNVQAISPFQTSMLNKKLEIGVSRLEDMRVMLDCEATPAYPEGVKPKRNDFDDLYFGAVGTRSNDGKSHYSILPLEVTALEVIDREIEMIRNTNIVRVTIEGTDYLTGGDASIRPEDMINISLNGVNHQYDYNNICLKTPFVYYFPQYSTPKVNSLQADIKTEKLEWSRQSDEQVKLNVKLKGGKVLYEGDLIELLRQAKNTAGSYIYKNQEDLDRIYVHPIRFVIDRDMTSQDIYVKIFIHNWELVTLIPEI